MMQRVRALLQLTTTHERGATAVEYALMAALIAVVIVIAVTALGVAVADIFEDPELVTPLS